MENFDIYLQAKKSTTFPNFFLEILKCNFVWALWVCLVKPSKKVTKSTSSLIKLVVFGTLDMPGNAH